MLKGTKRIAKKYSLDETKFLEFVRSNKAKYSLLEFDGEFLVSHWSVNPMVEDYKKTLEKPKEKEIKKKSK
jgi:hypothetical protein